MKRIVTILALMVCVAGCTPRIEVVHLNNYTSQITTSRSVECLWLPIEDGAPEAVVVAIGSERHSVPLNIRLARKQVDSYVPFPMEGVRTLVVDNCPHKSICWQHLTTSQPEMDKSYRQDVHFSPERGWTNDPNGMFYKDGEWHLCYQHNPVLTSHRADFRDPKVFWYAPRECWIMVLAAGNAMEIYSSENLREWAFESRCGEDYGYHTGVWECPDLFELPYEGGTKWVLLCSLSIPERGGSSVQYFVGEFDGHRFTPDKKQPEADLLNYGRDYYATVSWSGVEDGRKVVVGWQNNWDYANDLPTKGYRGYMSIPHQLKLVNYSGEPKLVAEPAQEVMAHRRTLISKEVIEIKDKYNAWRHNSDEGAYVVECNIENLSAQVVGLKLFNDSGEWVDVCFDFIDGLLRVDRTNSGEVDFNPRFPSISEAPLSESTEQHITMVVDRTSVECFTDIAAISNLVFPQGRYSRLSFHTIGSSATIRNLTIKEL